MSLPRFKAKDTAKVLTSPEKFMDYVKKRNLLPPEPPPEAVILCFHPGFFKWIKENHETKKSSGFCSFLQHITETRGKVAVTQRFMGAPGAAVVMEELIAWGVKKFIIVGFAGTLQKHVQIGDLVLCEKALRDEGTSYHYLPDSEWAFPAKKLTEKLRQALQEEKQPFHYGPSWTTDAIYRETVEEAQLYQSQGVVSVEMEASALFAVAQFRNVEAAAVFSISDSLADLVWQPEFHSEKPRAGLEHLFRATLRAFNV